MHPLHIITGLILAGLPLVSVELVSRHYNKQSELLRKSTHLLSALATLALMLFCSLNEIAIIAALFIVILLVTRRIKLWRSLYGVTRKSWGEVTYPIGVLIAAQLSQTIGQFVLAMLLLGISDTLASLIGQHFGTTKLPFTNKTYIGSFACFACSLAIGLGFLSHQPLHAFGLAFAVTAAEILGPRGFDNIFIPLAALGFLRILS